MNYRKFNKKLDKAFVVASVIGGTGLLLMVADIFVPAGHADDVIFEIFKKIELAALAVFVGTYLVAMYVYNTDKYFVYKNGYSMSEFITTGKIRYVRETDPRVSRIAPDNITFLEDNEVLVFGSKADGSRLDGTSLFAYKRFGAKWGVATGFTGFCYAIPFEPLNGLEMQHYIDLFIETAKSRPNLTFLVNDFINEKRSLKPELVAPMFQGATNVPNIALPESYWEVLKGTIHKFGEKVV